MIRQIISFSIIVILITSMLTNVDGIISSDNQKQFRLDDKVSTKTSMHHPNNFQVSLTENVRLSENLSPKNDQPEQFSITYTYSISIPEKMLLFGNHNIIKNIAIINQNLDPKTTMDKISNNDRIRLHGRSIVIDNILFNTQTPITLSQLES